MTSPAASRLPHWTAWLALALLLLVATFLRQLPFGESLWLDELHTSWTVHGSLGEVAPRAMMGNQPPLPYWLYWCYVQIVGESEATLRLPSLIASVASITVLFGLVWSWTRSESAALVAALALALEWHSLSFYASEARVYAVVQLLALVSIRVLWELLRTGDWRYRVALIFLSWLLFYTHYVAVLFLLAEGAAWLAAYFLRREMSYHPRAALLDGLIVLAGFVPAMGHLREIAARRGNWALFIESPTLVDLWWFLPQREILVAAIVLVGVLALFRWRRDPTFLNDLRQSFPIALVWLFVPLLLAWFLSWIDIARLFHERYLVYVMPASGALLGLTVAAAPRGRWQKVLAACLAVGILVTAFGEYQASPFPLTTPRRENWRAAIDTLNARHWHRGEPLFIASGLIEADWLAKSDAPRLREFCGYPLHALYELNSTQSVVIPLAFTSPGRLTAEQRRQFRDSLQQQGRVIAIFRGGRSGMKQFISDVQRSIDKPLTTREESFGTVKLIEFVHTP